MRNIWKRVDGWYEGFNLFAAIYSRIVRALKQEWPIPKPKKWHAPHTKGLSKTNAKFLVNGRWIFVPSGTIFIWGSTLDRDTSLCMP